MTTQSAGDGSDMISAAVEPQPQLTISTPNPVIVSPKVTVTGTIDPANMGDLITIEDEGTAIATVTADSNGNWSVATTLSSAMAHQLTAVATSAQGQTGTSTAINLVSFPFGAATLAFAKTIATEADTVPSTTQFVTTSSATIAAGTSVVVDEVTGASTIIGSTYTDLIAGSGGVTLRLSGGQPTPNHQEKLAFVGGSNTILLADSGYNIVIEGGTNTIFAQASGGITAAGATEVLSNAVTFTVAGSGNLVFGSTANSSEVIIDLGTADTIVAGSGATTLFGATGGLYYLGSGPAVLNDRGAASDTVVGGSGSSTIIGGASEILFQGSGSITYIAGGDDSIVAAAAGGIVAYGSAGDTIELFGTSSGAANYLIGGSGSETLNAAAAAGQVIIAAESANLVAALSSNSDNTFVMGSDADTVLGGSSVHDSFVFSNGQAGGSVLISGFTSTDTLDFYGYGAIGASQIIASEITSNGSTYIVLPDRTQITLLNATVSPSQNTFDTPPCYCHGTLILTDAGERPVESLAIGDGVVTASGAVRPVRWIGRRGYAGRFLAASPQVQPIRFAAGSLGGGLPARDLLVSPDHAMFLDDVLIPARCLLNGTTITRERGRNRVDYVHIELDSHDIIVAEGALSETFLDDDSRMMFANALDYAALYPDATLPGGFCAPRVDSGYALEAIRRGLPGCLAPAA